MKRIGIFGGAFDPPHIAHLTLARAAVAQFQLDQLRVFPTGSAWHKQRTLSETQHRLAMAHLAFDDLPKVFVDHREIERQGPTYTVDTLTELKAEFPDAAFYLFIGQDQALAFKTWKSWEAVLSMATLVVAQRPVESPRPNASAAAQWHNALPANVQSLDMPPLDVSATEIRARIASAQSVPPWLPAPVLHYIDQHRLYQTPTDDRIHR